MLGIDAERCGDRFASAFSGTAPDQGRGWVGVNNWRRSGAPSCLTNVLSKYARWNFDRFLRRSLAPHDKIHQRIGGGTWRSSSAVIAVFGRHARTHAIENKQTDRGRQIALLPLGVDITDHGRKSHLVIVRDLFQPEPEWFFQAHTGLVTADDDRAFDDE